MPADRISTPLRRGARTALTATLAAVAALVWMAAPAHAASVALTADAIVIDATEGDDSLLISWADEGFTPVATHVDIKDFKHPLTTAPGCIVGPSDTPYLEENEARCPVHPGITVNLRGGNDELAIYDPPQLAFTVPLTVDGSTGSDTINGASAPDLLRGGPGDDVLYGKEGNDTLDGGHGNDQLSGRAGDDHLDGGDGDDTLESESTKLNIADALDGADTIIGGPGSDAIAYFAQNAGLRITLDGVADDGRPGERDNIERDVETVGGGFGDDVIIASDAGHTLWGDLGNDTLIGGAGHDNLQGDQGADALDGRGGDDQLKGGCHDDVLTGGSGRDELISDGCFNWANTGLGDRLLAEDGEADALIFCSEVTDPFIGDVAVVDAIDPVTTSGAGACATVQVQRPAAGDGPGGGGTLPQGKTRKIKGNLVLITGSGAAGQAPKPRLDLGARRLTLGTLRWGTGGKVRVAASVRLGRRTLALGSKRFTLGAGASQTLALKLPSSAAKALRRRAKLTVKVAYVVGKKTYRKRYSVVVAKR